VILRLSSRFAGPVASASANAKEELIGNVTNGAPTTIWILRTRLVQSELKLAELRQIFTEDNENIRLAEATVAALKQRIESELKATATNEKVIAGMDLEIKAAEQKYVDLRRKLEQIALFLKLSPAQTYNRQIAEPPLAPKSSEWKKSLLVALLGSVAGLMLGLGVAGYREYSDHRLNSGEAVEAHLGLRSLAVVPQFDEAGVHAALEPPVAAREGRTS